MCFVLKIHLLPVRHLLISYLVTMLGMNQNVHQVLLYVNSNEKWKGMKNAGLKMPEKNQIYVRVEF